MTDASSGGRQLVLPKLCYERPNDAVEWLCRVFGFVEQSRMAGPDGTIYIADLRGPGGGAVLISGESTTFRQHIRAAVPDEYREASGRWWPNLSYSITIMVPDAEVHHDHARREGARIIAAPRDQPWGLRDYEAIDLEGRMWNFSQYLRDTNPQDWGATPA